MNWKANEPPIKLGRTELEEFLQEYSAQRYPENSLALYRQLGTMRIRGIFNRSQSLIRKMQGRYSRSTSKAKDQYDRSWGKVNYKRLLPEYNGPEVQSLVKWDRNYFDVSVYVLAKIQLSIIRNVINSLNPESVFEAGFGTGNKLLPLSAGFPGTKFGGIELSDSGVLEAMRIIEEKQLPSELIEFAPFEIRDTGALETVKLLQGSAEKIAEEDASYDLVYTCQALEQMEVIRDQVLSELRRISRKYVLMIEPFRDWNQKGIRRDRVIYKNYFQASINDLSRYGLKPIYIEENIPSKVIMGVGVVLAEIV